MKKLLLRAAVPVLLASVLGRPAQAQVRPEVPQPPAEPQPATSSPLPTDSLQVTLELLPDTLVAVPPIDSVKLAWLRTPPELRDLVADRIGCFETDVPHVFNGHVLAYVRLFTERQRTYTQRVLERENLYFPLFEKYLAKYNLPTDLKYLAVVESALIPTAKSRVGATGLWQFMGPTANDLRLRRDEWVDERMNPEKATEAACKHLRYLYGVFHDWELVLAAYNWGAGNMQRVLRRTGKKNYWDVHSHLPAETRNYVPTFTAIMYAMKYAQQHQLHAPELRYQYAEQLDTLHLGGRAFDLTRLARACGYTDSSALLRYNSELRKPWLPQGYRPYAVQLPAAARPALTVVDRETLFDYCRPLAELPRPVAPRSVQLLGVEPFPTRSLLAEGAPREAPQQPQPRHRRLRHTVKRGETVASVAARYDVSPTEVRRWNGLKKGTALAPRRQLVVFVPLPAASPAATTAPAVAAAPVRRPVVVPAHVAVPAAASAPAEAAAASGSTKAADTTAVPAALAAVAPSRPRQAAEAARPAARAAARPVKEAESRPAVAAVAADDTLPASYVVRPGDFLEKIARTHGLTVAQLMSWNRLTAETLAPGQTLRLRALPDAEQLIAATRETAAAAQGPVRRAALSASEKPVPTPKVHLVQPGDTLYNISRRYQGLTVEKLRELNNLKSDEVKPGQKLIVKG
ncbi:LysM peptidoglycan-binding domain-containing protein [Hymenobacter weizhouensis]|uniref:LysM peptidoglycan-binding domain-containing protein n=1 Tax=Hymenobacter sp. YIM 151500-1 TaxID=2987689 RepID=UPI00222626DF|nr:LysM peptidoglycan-binding domain-containing protein [Hymenobacter sp. YIM 151500-1]UYZ62740.1 LysM peptidoglycan-binding domain-containing protein [Hymenobacter sp. YIM 151500-1]